MFHAALAALALAAHMPQLPPANVRGGQQLLEVAADGSWAALKDIYTKGNTTDGVQIWDLRTGTLDRVLAVENTGYGYRTVIDPRGKWLAFHSRAAGEDGYNLQLLDFRTGKPAARTGLLPNGSRSLGFDADGTEVYAAALEKAGGWVAHAYSTADGKLLRKFWLPDVRQFELAPDGKTAVVELTHVWDLSTGKATRATLRNGYSAGFLNGSREVATYAYGAGALPVVVTDTVTGKVVREIAVPRQQSNDRVQLSPDGRSLAVSRYATSDLEVFDVGKDQPRFTLRNLLYKSDAMRFTPDGTGLIVLDKLRRFAVIDTKTGARRHSLDTDSYREVRSLAFADGGRTLVAATGRGYSRSYLPQDPTAGQVLQWDLTTGALKHAAAGLPTDIVAAFPSPKLDRALVVSGESAEVGEWRDLDSGKSLGELGVKATHYSQSPDGRFVAANSGTAVAVWDTSTGKRVADLGTNPGPHPPRFTPDGEWLLYQKAGTGHPPAQPVPRLGNGRGVGGEVIAVRVSAGKERMMHKTAEPGTPLPLPSGDGFVMRCTKLEYMAGDVCLFLDGRRIRFAVTEQTHTPLTISPDGRWVASGEARQHRAGPVFVWKVPTPKMLDEATIKNGVFPAEEQRVEPVLLPAHAERVTAVAFSPDGRTLATGGSDRTIRLWDVERGVLRATLWAPPPPDPDAAPTDWVAFTPGGHFAGTKRGRDFLRNVTPERHDPDRVAAAVGGK